MPRQTIKCPVCCKDLSLTREFSLGTETMCEYKCGHIFSKALINTQMEVLQLSACDLSGKSARPYQADGVKFIFDSNFNCIIADQMRLGKTPQALLALQNALKDRTPALVIVKGANFWQWVHEYKVWTHNAPFAIFPILGGSAMIIPGFECYIISMDTFGIPGTCSCCKHSGRKHSDDLGGNCTSKNCKCLKFKPSGDSMLDKLSLIGFKLVIVDEAHSFKNTDSTRSQTLVSFMNLINKGETKTLLNFTCSRCGEEWEEIGKLEFDKRVESKVISKSTQCPKCKTWAYIQQQYGENSQFIDKRVDKLLALANDNSTTESERVLAKQRAETIAQCKIEVGEPAGLVLLTGTPILNRAEEYFVPLNLIRPDQFPSLTRFQNEWLEPDAKGKFSRIKSYRLEEFKNLIKPFFLRREKEDVFKELPALDRIYTFIDPPDKEMYAKSYNKILDRIDEKLATKANPNYWDMAEHIMELRRLCGMMKIMWASDQMTAYQNDRPGKYALGIHHETVRDLLYANLGMGSYCHKLSGADNPDAKYRIMTNWQNDDKPYLIINMLAGGVGMDFHYCDYAMILERQWNVETERQFEFRFYNPDLKINPNPTTIEYVLVNGSFEEFWYNMLEEKRQNVDPLVYNNYNPENDTGVSFRGMMEATVSARM